MPRKIFIVDDEPDVSRLVARRIQSMGYDVRCFYDAETALQEIEVNLPDLVLLDIRLPDISGLEVFKILRSKEKSKRIPIVFFSAHSSKKEFCLNELGAEGFVEKPYDPQELKQVLSSLVALS